MKASRQRGVAPPHWPEPDRLVWEAAFIPETDFLDESSQVSSWTTTTIREAERVIDQVARGVSIDPSCPPGSRLADGINRGVIVSWINSESGRLSPRSVAYRCWLLKHALLILAPDCDWTWFDPLLRRLKRIATASPPPPRPIVHAATLYHLGLQVMRENADGSLPEALVLYRSGLAVALLAVAPMRMANLAGLVVGRQLQKVGEQWIVTLSATETKTRRADQWPISIALSRWIDHYLGTVRPALRRRAPHLPETGHFWIGQSGRPIGHQVLRPDIVRLTAERLDIAIQPHTFRHCAATTFALERPGDGLATSALLGHASPRTTQRHYILQQRHLVQQDYLNVLRQRRCAGTQQ